MPEDKINSKGQLGDRGHSWQYYVRYFVLDTILYFQ